MTLIDCPGLSDAGGKDQQILDDMYDEFAGKGDEMFKGAARELKKSEGGAVVVDLFVMMMTGDRLKNAALMENMKCYVELLGGMNETVWDNVIIVVPKQDYNPINHGEPDDSDFCWNDELIEKEKEVKEIVKNQFGKEPIGAIAISQLLPSKSE